MTWGLVWADMLETCMRLSEPEVGDQGRQMGATVVVAISWRRGAWGLVNLSIRVCAVVRKLIKIE